MTAEPRVSFLVVGESLVDIVEREDGSSTSHVGGSPANVAVGLARLGRRVELATSIGADARGRQIAAHLRANAVDLTPGSMHAVTSSTAIARIGADGGADYAFDIAWAPEPIVPTRMPDCVHTGSIGSWLAPGAAEVLRTLRRLAPDVVISFDPNVRADLVTDRRRTTTQIERLVALADIVKVSDEDLAWLQPGREPRQVAAAWLDLGASAVFVTLGAHGALAMTAGAEAAVSARPVEVVDTVGAGDAFMAGLLDAMADLGLLRAETSTAIAALDSATLGRIGAHAGEVAALTVSRAGAEPPTRAELNRNRTDTA